MLKSYEEGGIKAIDFVVMNAVLKMKWLQSHLRDSNEIWFALPLFVFDKVGGIEFLLKCDFALSKLLVKVSAFHQQVLLHWKMMYKHNFSPNVPLWNNRVILSRRKSIFMEDLMNKHIWSIMHLLDENGNILKLDEFNHLYSLDWKLMLR